MARVQGATAPGLEKGDVRSTNPLRVLGLAPGMYPDDFPQKVASNAREVRRTLGRGLLVLLRLEPSLRSFSIIFVTTPVMNQFLASYV